MHSPLNKYTVHFRVDDNIEKFQLLIFGRSTTTDDELLAPLKAIVAVSVILKMSLKPLFVFDVITILKSL